MHKYAFNNAPSQSLLLLFKENTLENTRFLTPDGPQSLCWLCSE